MAQIVCITAQTLREDIAYEGDIVEVQEDDVELSGPGYAVFDIVHIPNLTKNEAMQEIYDAKSETRFYKKSKKFEVEISPGVFQKITKEAKYKATAKNMSSTDKLAMKTATKAVATATLKSKLKCCTIDQLDKLRID